VRRLWLLLTVLLLPLSALQAQPVTGPAEPLYVLVVDWEGAWQVERQERFRLPMAEPVSRQLSTDWKALLDTRPFRRLSYTDRLALLAYPERLLSSSWAAQLFNARHVLVLRPLGDQRVQGRLFDLEWGRDYPLVIPRDGQGEVRERALAAALRSAGVASEPVLAHPEGVYHRTGATHLSARVHYEPVESARRAEQFGWTPCAVCYPPLDREGLYDELDLALGELVAAQIESTYPVAAEGKETARVRRVGQRLLRENRSADQGYRFEVLQTDTINAYCAPTGPVYLTSGLLQALPNDDQLAAVLGHELAHSERRHARRQYEAAQQTGMLGLLVTVATGVPWASLGTDILGTVMVRGYSRGYELEADRDGPAEYLRVQDTLMEVARRKGGGGLPWLRTHPGSEERKQQLREILERTAPVRKQLEALEGWDHGMAGYLKSRVLLLSENPAALEEYLQRYQTLAKLLDTTPRSNPPGVPEEVWEALAPLLQTP
jgi:hypothetical protein